MGTTELIAIAVVRRPVGLKGFCAVEPFGATLASLQTPCEVRIGKDKEGAESISIEEIVPMPKGFRCRFGGRNSLEEVNDLRGSLIFVPQDALPGPGEGAFYQYELKGAQVYSDVDGSLIGRVAEVHNFPSSDTLEVERQGGGTLLIPLSVQAVASVDAGEGRITVRQSFVEELLE